MQQSDKITVTVLNLAKQGIARVCTIKDPDDRVETCEDLDIVFEEVELWASVSIAFCNSSIKCCVSSDDTSSQPPSRFRWTVR